MGLNFCPDCGEKLEAGVKFCPACGREITEKDVAKAKESKPQIPIEQLKETKQVAPGGPQIYPGFWTRFFAYIIDIILIALIGWGISLAFPASLRWYFGAPYWLLFINDLINWIIGFLYFFLLEAYNKGQTFGKMALSIRTVDENTLKEAEPKQYVLNNIARGTIFLLVDFIIGFFVNLDEDNKRLRIMQNVSDTVVIRT